MRRAMLMNKLVNAGPDEKEKINGRLRSLSDYKMSLRNKIGDL